MRLLTDSKSLYDRSIRRTLTYAHQSFLAGKMELLAGMNSQLARSRVHIINLHHLFPDEEQGFIRILSRLAETHTFVTYTDAVTKIWSGNIDGPYIAFSFDDGIKNCVRAAEILRDFGGRACLFLCPSIVGVKDEVRLRSFGLNTLRLGPVEFVDWDDVHRLLLLGHEIGSHAMRHQRISDLPVSQVEAEIGESMEVLSRRIGRVRHFAWPFGRFEDFSALGARLAYETGFESCASGVRGCHTSQAVGRALCLRREHVMAKWPVHHILYFLARSLRVSSRETNCWPEGWASSINLRGPRA